MNVVLGEYDKEHKGRDCVSMNGQKECTDGELKIAIASVTVHEKYNSHGLHNDIALIKLNKTAPYTGKINSLRPSDKHCL